MDERPRAGCVAHGSPGIRKPHHREEDRRVSWANLVLGSGGGYRSSDGAAEGESGPELAALGGRRWHWVVDRDGASYFSLQDQRERELLNYKQACQDFLVVQWLRLRAPNARALVQS